MTTGLLDVARAAVDLAAKATPAPWIDGGVAGRVSGGEYGCASVVDIEDRSTGYMPDTRLVLSDADAALIAHAGTHHGSLGAALIEASEEIETLRGLLGLARDAINIDSHAIGCDASYGPVDPCKCGLAGDLARIDSALRRPGVTS